MQSQINNFHFRFLSNFKMSFFVLYLLLLICVFFLIRFSTLRYEMAHNFSTRLKQRKLLRFSSHNISFFFRRCEFASPELYIFLWLTFIIFFLIFFLFFALTHATRPKMFNEFNSTEYFVVVCGPLEAIIQIGTTLF